jgi:serine/threonine protein kinase
MKYMSEGSLREVLAKVKGGDAPKFWNATGIAIIVCGIVVGLEFIHSEHLIHRDIKPANLLLDKRGHCRIGDFGSSKYMDSGSRMSINAVTQLYQAPELWHNRPYTNKIDVFSFALVLYEILVGDYGNSTNNPRALADGFRAKLPADMRPEMKSMISRCWSEDPNQRPSFAEVLMELKQIEFKILPDVDGPVVREFLEGISRKQMKRGSLQKFRKKAEISRLMELAFEPKPPGLPGVEPQSRFGIR